MGQGAGWNLAGRVRHIRRVLARRPLRLLYLSCHSILEFDELRILRELGCEVYSPGDFVSPEDAGSPHLRPGLEDLRRGGPGDHEAFYAFGTHSPQNKYALSRSFVDRFDAVIVMHLPIWITANWEAMRHKPVVWRTIGQSTRVVEKELEPYRKDGLRVVRYSPCERNLQNFMGEDALIRFYKDPAEFEGWTGYDSKVMSIVQKMPLRKAAVHFDIFCETVRPFACELYGGGNAEAGAMDQGEVSADALRAALRKNQAYFFVGTHPASYTLGFIEAWMTGIPVVALGRKLMHDRFEDEGLYEVPSLLEEGVTGFVGDDVEELQSKISVLLADGALRNRVSRAGRARAIEVFGKHAVMTEWKRFLDRI
jgi:glycosyltransferase involved in cell wall biosynthesis